MSAKLMGRGFGLWLASLAGFVVAQEARPIRLLPENPHYFEFRGKPCLLLTSGEHYGAVLNLDFDIIPYLDELASHGFNQTRTFAGTYREVPGSFKIRENTLAPVPGRYLAPWKRVSKDGEPERFDLDQFEPAYFERLKSFLGEAGKRGIVVELVLFCPMYGDELWEVNPMNGKNNMQKLPAIGREEVYALKHEDLTKRQLAFVRRVVEEVHTFDNVYYELCNEPYFGGVTLEWQRAVADAIVESEKSFSQKHLIAQNIANQKARIEDPNPAVSIFNFHYAEPAAALDNLGLGRALGDDETGFAGTADRAYRTEAWLWILSGGGEFSHLDYSFTTEKEDGSANVEEPTPGGGGRKLRSQLSLLKRMGERVDLRRARPDPKLLVPSEGIRTAALVVANERYLGYLSGSMRGRKVQIGLPPGRYLGRWVDPRDASKLGEFEFNTSGDVVGLEPPEVDEDLALEVERQRE
jgi:hypothetical protein